MLFKCEDAHTCLAVFNGRFPSISLLQRHVQNLLVFWLVLIIYNMAHSIIFPKFSRSVLYSLVTYNTSKKTMRWRYIFHGMKFQLSCGWWRCGIWNSSFLCCNTYCCSSINNYKAMAGPCSQFSQGKDAMVTWLSLWKKFINKLVVFQFLLDIQDIFFLEIVTASHILCY